MKRSAVMSGVLVVVAGLAGAFVWSAGARGQYTFEKAECVNEDPCDGDCILMRNLPGNGNCLAYECSSNRTALSFCKHTGGNKKCGGGLLPELSPACDGCTVWTCSIDASGMCLATGAGGGNCRCGAGGGNMADVQRTVTGCSTF